MKTSLFHRLSIDIDFEQCEKKKIIKLNRNKLNTRVQQIKLYCEACETWKKLCCIIMNILFVWLQGKSIFFCDFVHALSLSFLFLWKMQSHIDSESINHTRHFNVCDFSFFSQCTRSSWALLWPFYRTFYGICAQNQGIHQVTYHF